MIVILKKNAESQQVELFTAWLHNMGLETHLSVGENHTIVGLVGDTSRVDIESILALDIVEMVQRIQEPYKNANRKFHEQDTVITLKNGAFLKLLLPKRGGLGGGMPHHEEYREKIIARLSGLSCTRQAL